MDEMRINSAFTRGILERIIEKVIEKKLGHKVNLVFREPIEAILDKDMLAINLDMTISIRKDELRDILSEFL